MPDQDKIVAIGLLTQHDLSALGANFRRAFPIEDDGGFDGLLRAIELADEEYHRLGWASADSDQREKQGETFRPELSSSPRHRE